MSRLKKGRRFNLGYALGELLLITLGIYLAFALNNWNESRKEGKLEQFYLNKLLTDVERDIAQLEWHLQIDSSHIAGARVLDALLAQGRSVDRDSLKSFLNAFNVNPSFRMADFSYRSLLQSGDYRILRSDSLRNELDRFYLELMPGVIITEEYYRNRLNEKYFPIKESVYMARSQEFINIDRLFDPVFRDNVYVLPAYIRQEMSQLELTLEAARQLSEGIRQQLR